MFNIQITFYHLIIIPFLEFNSTSTILPPDEAQSAHIVGSFVVGVISTIIAVIVISDIPTLYQNITGGLS